MTRPAPLWRWFLFCVALDLYWRTGAWTKADHWIGRLMAWCVLPEWLGWDGEPLESREVPW